MSLRNAVIRLANEHPELRKDILPILRKTSGTSRVRDLGQGLGKGYTPEKALDNIQQYTKWSREIMKIIDARLKELEKAGVKSDGRSSIWTRVATAYEIANTLGDIEESFG